MNEYPRHYRGPEVQPETAHQHIITDMRETATQLWTPGETLDTFTFNRSAAGRELAASIPAKGPVTIAVSGPSRRMHDAISRVLAYHDQGSFVTITVLDPREAATQHHHGVGIKMERIGATEPLLDTTLEYGMFLHFIDRSGLCEPANRRQRLGRWATEIFDCYTNDKDKNHQANGRPLPPDLGA